MIAAETREEMEARLREKIQEITGLALNLEIASVPSTVRIEAEKVDDASAGKSPAYLPTYMDVEQPRPFRGSHGFLRLLGLVFLIGTVCFLFMPVYDAKTLLFLLISFLFVAAMIWLMLSGKHRQLVLESTDESAR